MNSTTSLDFTSLAMNWSMAIDFVLVSGAGSRTRRFEAVYIAGFHPAQPRSYPYPAASDAQPSGLNTRRVEGGNFASLPAGRIGRGEKLPPQFGQRPPSRVSTQSRQNVHSNVQ